MFDLTHLNENGDAHMVDISGQASTERTAIASGVITMSLKAIGILADNTAEKGDVLGTARIAAIQAAKQTGFLIPLCHPIALNHIRVDFDIDKDLARVKATVTASTEGQTGVEMEALMGVNIALLTIYDMMKAVDKTMIISQVHLEEKTGGKSGNFIFTDDYENIDF